MNITTVVYSLYSNLVFGAMMPICNSGVKILPACTTKVPTGGQPNGMRPVAGGRPNGMHPVVGGPGNCMPVPNPNVGTQATKEDLAKLRCEIDEKIASGVSEAANKNSDALIDALEEEEEERINNFSSNSSGPQASGSNPTTPAESLTKLSLPTPQSPSSQKNPVNVKPKKLSFRERVKRKAKEAKEAIKKAFA